MCRLRTHTLWALLLSPFANIAAIAHGVGPFTTHTADRPGVHIYSALRFTPGGRAAVAYGDDRLYYAELIGSIWTRTVVDDQVCISPPSLEYTNRFVDLGFDAAGEPGISYYDANTQTLKYAFRVGGMWMAETVDPGGQVGEINSLVIDPLGRPHIMYSDIPAGRLRHAWRDAGAWQFETIDPGARASGVNSVAIDGSGQLHVAYGDQNTSSLKYGKQVGGIWQFEVVDTDSGSSPSLVIDALGRPRIAYNARLGLTYANWDGVSWQTYRITNRFSSVPSLVLDGAGLPHIAMQEREVNLESSLWDVHHDGSVWIQDQVDTQLHCGWDATIATDPAGRPQIAHADVYADQLRLTKYSGTSWSTEVIDKSRLIGTFTSVQVDSREYPAIAAYDNTDYALIFARWDGTAWKLETVDTVNRAGYRPSIAIDSADQPHISYVAILSARLRYARHNGTTWVKQTVDSTNLASGTTSLALDPLGNPHIAYGTRIGTSDFDLTYAHWDGGAWVIEILDSAGDVGRYSSLALNPTGRPRIAYVDDTTDTLKYASFDGTSWTFEVVPTPGRVIGNISLAVDPSDRAHIAIYDADASGVVYVNGSPGSWVSEVVDSAGRTDPVISLDQAGSPVIVYPTLNDLYLARRGSLNWFVTHLTASGSGAAVTFSPTGEFSVSTMHGAEVCEGGDQLQVISSRHLGPLKSFRSRVDSLAPGWKDTSLPVSSSNDDELGGFPVDENAPGNFVDNAVPDAPLVMYRDLVDDENAGNALKLTKVPGGIRILH